MRRPRYRAIVVGKKLLIGGVKTHSSSWFDSKKEALDWEWAIRTGNESAGREVALATLERRSPDGKKDVHMIYDASKGSH